MVESMNIIKLFPTDIFEFYNASISTEQVISDLTALSSPLKNSSNISYTHNIHRLEKFKNLLDKLNFKNQIQMEKKETLLKRVIEYFTEDEKEEEKTKISKSD